MVVGDDGLPVWILLPTWNGARFVAEQIASIERQTVTDWRLLVRDDGSSDDTVAVVDALASADARIERLRDDAGNLGVVANVDRLLAAAQARGARRVMLADQDDVWLPDKIAVSRALLHEAEREAGPGRPVLVHTDLAVVDEQLRPIAPSFLRFQRKRHEPVDPLGPLLVTNFVTGCTVLFNQALLRLATPVPTEAPMHDWWLALCAAAAGTIRFHPTATVLYRQHGSNTLPDKGYLRQLNPARASWARAWRRGGTIHRQAIAQVAAVAERLGDGPDTAATRQRLRTFLAMCEPGVAGLTRVRTAARLGVHGQQVLRTALIYLRLLTSADATRR